MVKLIIIRGNSGSGKTTVATSLQKRLGRNALVISQDVIRRNMLWVNDGKDTQCLPLLLDLLQYGKQNCNYVILEGILHSRWYRILFEAALELYGTNIFAYYYDLPFEETLMRHSMRPQRSEFGEEAMRSWWNEKDYIGIIPEKTITLNISLADTIEMIYSDVTK